MQKIKCTKGKCEDETLTGLKTIEKTKKKDDLASDIEFELIRKMYY